jgi:hypothetical protein
MTFYQAAIDNFPEDQAAIDADFALSLFETEGSDYFHQWLIKERSSVIHNTFDDNQAQIKRYIDRFNDLTAQKTNLYM